MQEESGFYPIEYWGIDHWSLLAYIFMMNVDNCGIIDCSKIRINKNKNISIVNTLSKINHATWHKSYGTRLKNYNYTDIRGKSYTVKTNPNLKISDHDDIDCIFDMQEEGIIERNLELPLIKLTEKGKQLACRILIHKIENHDYSTFNVPEEFLNGYKK